MITVASHNTMHGVFLEGLLAYYQRVVDQHAVDVLCLQENVALRQNGNGSAHGFAGTHADQVCRSLGNFRCVCLKEYPALATLVRGDLQIESAFLVPLPLLDRLNWIERLYIRGGRATRKCALVTLVRCQQQIITVVNFHLETAGTNVHRRRQVAAMAEALVERGLTRRVAVCGDTNAFSWSRAAARHALSELLEPLDHATGARPHGDHQPTHYFARQRENLLPHRVATLLGKLGIDHPLPYDVICSDLEAELCGSVVTEESDHDLVYARLRAPLPR